MLGEEGAESMGRCPRKKVRFGRFGNSLFRIVFFFVCLRLVGFSELCRSQKRMTERGSRACEKASLFY